MTKKLTRPYMNLYVLNSFVNVVNARINLQMLNLRAQLLNEYRMSRNSDS